MEFYVISILVIVLIRISGDILIKKNKIKKNGNLHGILSILTNIYLSIIIIYTVYKFTDTLGDFVKVISIWAIVITIIKLHFKYLAIKRFNWLFNIIIAVILVGCYLYTSWFFLVEIPIPAVGVMICVITCDTYKLSNSRSKLVLATGFLTYILAIVLLAINGKEIENLCKPVRFALEEAIAKGYNIEDNDYFFTNYAYENSKEVPIVVHINRIEEDDFKFIRVLEFKYNNNKVTFVGETVN